MHATEVYWKGQARALRDAAEAWKQDHEEAQSVLKFEAFLDHPLATYQALGKFYRAVWDDLFSGRLAKPLRAGIYLREVFGQAALGFEDLLDVLHNHQQKGYSIARAGELEQAARDLRAWEADIAARWPRFDPDELRAALEGPAEFVDPEEIYREFPEIRRPDQA
jgi:hypothetical protein